VKDMYLCGDAEVQHIGNTANPRPAHGLVLSGSPSTAAQALPLPQLASAEPYLKANPPSRGRGTRLGYTACFRTRMYGCCTSEHQTPDNVR